MKCPNCKDTVQHPDKKSVWVLNGKPFKTRCRGCDATISVYYEVNPVRIVAEGVSVENDGAYPFTAEWPEVERQAPSLAKMAEQIAFAAFPRNSEEVER